ncbi:HET domain-containing protein [Trichoderma evansii]
MLTMTKLEYQPLIQAREIRLTDILPRDASDTIRVHLYHGNLNQETPPHFEALSYVWGPADNSTAVEIQLADSTDGIARLATLMVTPNLATALRHLRYPNRPRTEDYAERSSQGHCIAFIGPECDDSTYALDTLEHVGAMVQVNFANGVVKPSLAGEDEAHWADMQQSPPFGHREMLAIYHLVHREWFDRVWVRQEIGLGYHGAVLQCGNKQTPWQLFSQAIFTLRRKPLTHEGLMGNFDVVQRRDFGDRIGRVDTVALYSVRGCRLANLRRQIAGSRCSDERDKIYGVLGSLREIERAIGIIPDYTLTVAEVYTDAARKQILHTAGLTLFNQCDLSPRPRFPELPSWVPDWSTELASSIMHAFVPLLLSDLPAFERIDDRLIHKGSSLTDISLEIRRVFHDAYKDVTAQRAHDEFVEAFTRALWLGDFADRWFPASSHRPPFEDCVALIATIVGEWPSHDKMPTLPFSDPVAARYLDSVRDACRTRTLLLTRDGYVGLAPGIAAIGDEVVMLFGCNAPIVVRSSATNATNATNAIYPQSSDLGSLTSHTQYRVVGECFVHGMMDGEIILGDLPRNIHSQFNGLKFDLRARYIDVKTKIASDEDPRTESFLAKLVEKGILSLPTLDSFEKLGKMKALTKAGYNVQTFDLI